MYDLSPGNEFLAPLGLGFFHSGVEVHGTEYTFASGGGIFSHAPRAPPSGAAPGSTPPFRFSVVLGAVEATSGEVARTVEGLRGAWPGDRYNLLTCNCNSFADELAGLGDHVAEIFNAHYALHEMTSDHAREVLDWLAQPSTQW